ncbi:MAG: TIM barrel protein, partial [Pseudomonadota bacterium]
MMQVGVFAKTFAGSDPDQVLAACQKAGFKTVQYNMSCSGLASLPSSIPPNVAHAVMIAAGNHGIEIAAVSATYNMVDANLKRRETERRSFEAIAKIAGLMGADLLTVCSGSMHPTDKWQYHPSNDDPKSWIDMCKEFELLLELAEQYNVFIGVEPEQANVVNSAQMARRLLDEFSGSRIRIVLDPANIVEDQPPSDQYKILDEA